MGRPEGHRHPLQRRLGEHKGTATGTRKSGLVHCPGRDQIGGPGGRREAAGGRECLVGGWIPHDGGRSRAGGGSRRVDRRAARRWILNEALSTGSTSIQALEARSAKPAPPS